jgi:hypothetical protein
MRRWAEMRTVTLRLIGWRRVGITDGAVRCIEPRLYLPVYLA